MKTILALIAGLVFASSASAIAPGWVQLKNGHNQRVSVIKVDATGIYCRGDVAYRNFKILRSEMSVLSLCYYGIETPQEAALALRIIAQEEAQAKAQAAAEAAELRRREVDTAEAVAEEMRQIRLERERRWILGR